LDFITGVSELYKYAGYPVINKNDFPGLRGVFFLIFGFKESFHRMAKLREIASCLFCPNSISDENTDSDKKCRQENNMDKTFLMT
jgi:hypothetical protein